MCYCGRHRSDMECDYWDLVEGQGMKERYYMGAAVIGTNRGTGSIPMHETLEQAIEHVSRVVDKEQVPRYIVKVIAKVEPAARPVRVTMLDDGKEDRLITVHGG